MSIAVVNRSTALKATDLPFWVAAWDQQAREVCAAWGCAYQPVVIYSPDFVPDGSILLTIRDAIDAPGAAGFHADDIGIPFIEVKVTSDTFVTGSHEIAEYLVDPTVNLWAPYDADHEQAIEVSDRVEGDSYLVPVSVMGEARQVPVSNYLLPSAFDPQGKAPFDRMGRLTTWNGMTSGGYCILRSITSGKVEDVFNRRLEFGGLAGIMAAGEKLANKQGRLFRRLNAVRQL